MEVNSEIGAVIDGRIRIFYLCFTYIPVSTFSFVFSEGEFQEREQSAQVSCEFSFYRLPLCHS